MNLVLQYSEIVTLVQVLSARLIYLDHTGKNEEAKHVVNLLGKLLTELQQADTSNA